MESKPAIVPMAKQVGEVRSVWNWTEPSIWTERMLTALENGVKGGKWYSLIDKVYAEDNLYRSYVKVAQNKGAAGIDHVTTEMFTNQLEKNLRRLQKALEEETYQPQAIKRVEIPKPGSKAKRPLGIPTVRDRVVQTALRNVIEPIFEKEFAEHSYGFRPGRGCKDALRRVTQLLKEGYQYIVDADLKSYFDTIPHDRLLQRVEEKISDGRILSMVAGFLEQKVMDDTKEWTPEEGSPQGAVISPLLSNIYLDPLDQQMSQAGYEMIRYADDFVILCQSEAEAIKAMAQVQQWVAEAGLQLHPEKSKVVTHEEGFDFLGYHFERGYRWPRKKSIQKLKETIRAKTKRANGHSLKQIITNVSKTLRGWFEYFKHSHKTTFRAIDSWVRMRLRSILRKRKGLKGRGRGRDHQRWPNAYFAGHGLFSLVTAHESASQSSKR